MEIIRNKQTCQEKGREEGKEKTKERKRRRKTEHTRAASRH